MELVLKRLGTETLHDFLEYFDHRAFLNDEDWAGCYCQAYLHPPGTDAGEIFGEGRARAMACDKVVEGSMDGYLAYSEGKVVGWCAAAESKMFQAIPGAEDKLARIICFNIDPDLRGQSLASRMLDLILDDLEKRGFEAVEAAPRDEEFGPRSFQGTKDMFAKRGFDEIMELTPGQTLMRRYLP